MKKPYISAPTVELLHFVCADPLLSSFTVPTTPTRPGVTTDSQGNIELPPITWP